jgi:membrane-associated phospholipid phosphatase
VTNFDWNYLQWIQTSPHKNILFYGVIVGGIVPLWIVPGLFILSTIRKQISLQKITSTLFVASAFAWTISSLYKAFTGRVQPLIHNGVFIDTSHVWNFGFMKYGIFWGWPSSHTTIAFAMGTSMILLHKKNKLVAILSIVYMLFVGIGVTTRIHWFSEFVAGAIIGTLVGYAVGIVMKKNT